MSRNLITPQWAEANGFTVDRHTYPHFAYKGDRFNPTESKLCYTDREAELIGAVVLGETVAATVIEFIRALSETPDAWRDLGLRLNDEVLAFRRAATSAKGGV